MGKLKQVREQLMSIYTDDDSLIMKNIRNIIDDVDKYLAGENTMGVPATVLQTINEYDIMIQIAMEDFNALKEVHTAKYIHERAWKAQEILTYLLSQSHYISYIKDKYANALPPESRKTYMSKLYMKMEENKEFMGQYRTIISNISKEMDYININLQERSKQSGT